MLLAINQGVKYGVRRVIPSAIGNAIGNLVIAFISLAGLKALLMVFGSIFSIIKVAGAFYLLYIGAKLFFEKVPSGHIAESIMPFAGGKTRLKLFWEGFFIAVVNPKGILFFTALFPQFIDISEASANEFAVVFVTLAGIAFIGFVLYAASASGLRILFHLPWFRKSYNCATGAAFIGSGLALALAKSEK